TDARRDEMRQGQIKIQSHLLAGGRVAAPHCYDKVVEEQALLAVLPTPIVGANADLDVTRIVGTRAISLEIVDHQRRVRRLRPDPRTESRHRALDKVIGNPHRKSAI